MRVLLWGDAGGVDCVLASGGSYDLCGIVGAANRPASCSTVADMAAANELPFFRQPRRKDAAALTAFVESLRALEADLFLVNSYSMILNPAMLELPRLGAYNIHAGLVPQYRGANVLNWVLVNGEDETGVSIMKMDAGIDTGDVVMQRRVPIAFDDTAITLRAKLLARAQEMVPELLTQIRRGEIQCTPQDETRATSWPLRKPVDGRVDWAWPAERIYNLIRAVVAPWPGACYEDENGEEVVIDQLMSLDEVRELKERMSGSL